MKQCNLTKGLVVFLTIMFTLFCGVMPGAWAEEEADDVLKCNSCEGQIFKGCYGFSHKGMMDMLVVDAGGNPVVDDDGNPVFTGPIPMASAGIFCLDGMEKLIGREMVNLGGTSFPAKIIGRYRVNPDCTGRALICATPINGGPAIKSEIVFVIAGPDFEELQMLTTEMTSCDANNLVVAKPIGILGIAKKQGRDDDDDD